MRSCDLRIEQADRRGRETERRHRRELGRLHDTAKAMRIDLFSWSSAAIVS